MISNQKIIIREYTKEKKLLGGSSKTEKLIKEILENLIN